MFKKINFFKIADDQPISADALEKKLASHRFNRVGSQDMKSIGWAPVFTNGDLVHRLEGQWMIKLVTEERVLPGAVVKRMVAERAAEEERQCGHKLGKKQLRDLKEVVLQELRPKALCKMSEAHVWIDPVTGFIATDGKPDTVAEMILKADETFPIVRVNTAQSPSSAMTAWLLGDPPSEFTIDNECELKSIEGETVKYTNVNLDRKDIRDHISEGKYVTQLALTHEDAISFVMTQKFELKKLDYLGAGEDGPSEDEDPVALFDSAFAIMVGAIQPLYPALIEALGGEAA